MGETVVRQLQFSPLADPHPQHAAFGLQQVQQRLDARLAWAGDNNSNSNKGTVFRVPSDSEDEDDGMGAMGANHISSYLQHSQELAEAASGTGPSQTGFQGQLQPQENFTLAFTASTSQQSPVEAVLWAHTRQLQATALLSADYKKQQLHKQLQAVEQQLAQELQDVQQQLAHKRARAAAADEESRKQRSLERSRKLQEVQQQQAALQQAHATALQEARKQQQREAEARRQAAEAAAAAERAKQQREEEERKKQQEAAAAAAAAAAKKAEEEAKTKAAAAATSAASQPSQRQQQQPPAVGSTPAGPANIPAAAAAASPSTTDPHLKASESALQHEAELRAKLQSAEAEVADLMTKPELKQVKRGIEKKITLWVSQISGTQQQVTEKSNQLVQMLHECRTSEERTLACLTLAGRMISQCEVQVARIGTFAFPLAFVCVRVGAQVPQFMDVLLAKLQKACPLLVPKYIMYSPDSDKDKWYDALGYKMVDDAKTGEKRRENADEFVARMSAMVLLFASIVQTEAAGNPIGPAHGWVWMARFLNTLPPTRPCAAALMSFLAHAGFRLSALYGRQFMKLLRNVTTEFLPALEAKAARDADLRAVGTRLQSYVDSNGFKNEPDGRSLKLRDESSYANN